VWNEKKNPGRIGGGCQPTMNRGNTSDVRVLAACGIGSAVHIRLKRNITKKNI
jgi:hypothetical protein